MILRTRDQGKKKRSTPKPTGPYLAYVSPGETTMRTLKLVGGGVGWGGGGVVGGFGGVWVEVGGVGGGGGGGGFGVGRENHFKTTIWLSGRLAR